MKKKQPRTIAPVPQLNPGWLQSDAEGPEPPMQQKARVLPFLEQEWRDFERVCRRLAECGGAVEAAQAYGTPGQAQYGIDILVRLTDGTYEVWQTKRYRVFTPAAVHEAVRLFLKHKWARQARKFVLAVACELDATKVVDAIEAARDQLRTRSIAFEPLDGTHVKQLWLRTVRPRGQRGCTTWQRVARLAAAFLPTPRILHPWPHDRFLVSHPRWKASA